MVISLDTYDVTLEPPCDIQIANGGFTPQRSFPSVRKDMEAMRIHTRIQSTDTVGKNQSAAISNPLPNQEAIEEIIRRRSKSADRSKKMNPVRSTSAASFG